MIEPARLLQSKGFEIYATKGTSSFLSTYKIPNTRVYMNDEEGEPKVLRMLHNKEIDLVVSVPKVVDIEHIDNGYKVRRAAVDLNIPLITNSRLAGAFINAFCSIPIDDLDILSWEELK